MKSRREFLKKAVGISVASSGSQVKEEREAATNLFSRERMRLRHKERHLVWNNDGSDMLAPAYQRGNWPVPVPSVDQFIDNLMRFILGTPVSSIFYCAHVNEPDWEIPLTHIRALGPNPFKHVVDFAHRHGKECFYSIRMNDIHASYWPPNRLTGFPFAGNIHNYCSATPQLRSSRGAFCPGSSVFSNSKRSTRLEVLFPLKSS